MRNLLLIVVFSVVSAGFSGAKAQEVETLKQQREAVKLNLDLIDKKIELKKAIEERDKREAKAVEANARAEGISTVDGNASSDPKEIKKAQRTVKQAETANKNLQRGNDKIVDLEAQIKGLETRIENAPYRIEISEN